MLEYLSGIQRTIDAINDIEKAIGEYGIDTKDCNLMEYGNLIRRIAGGSSYPDYATLILKRITNIPTFVSEIHNVDFYEGVFIPSVDWFTTEQNNVYNFRNDIITRQVFVANKIDKNTQSVKFTSSANVLVELIEVTE